MLLTLFSPLFLLLKMASGFTSDAYIQVHFRLDFFTLASNMDPDQTAPKRAV